VGEAFFAIALGNLLAGRASSIFCLTIRRGR